MGEIVRIGDFFCLLVMIHTCCSSCDLTIGVCFFMSFTLDVVCSNNWYLFMYVCCVAMCMYV